MNVSEGEESPYQIYMNIYCDECSDRCCPCKVDMNMSKTVKDCIFQCSELRYKMSNYYKDD